MSENDLSFSYILGGCEKQHSVIRVAQNEASSACTTSGRDEWLHKQRSGDGNRISSREVNRCTPRKRRVADDRSEASTQKLAVWPNERRSSALLFCDEISRSNGLACLTGSDVEQSASSAQWEGAEACTEAGLLVDY